MTGPDRADPDVSFGPTIYASDPPAVVDFLTHPDDRPYHLAADAGAWAHNPDCESGWWEDMCPDCREAADAARCRWCSGTGIYSDETISRACPYCGATGEAGDD